METGQAPKDVKDGGVGNGSDASGEDTVHPPSTSSQGNDEAGSPPKATSRIIDVDDEPMVINPLSF